MRNSITILALGCALGLAASPVAAQEQTLSDEVAAVAAQLQDKLRQLAAIVEAPFPDVREQMDPLIRAAVPAEPAGDADWAWDMNFDNTNAVTDNGAAPTEGRQLVFNDAQACIARYPEVGPVVHFRRIRQGVLRGHQCVMAGITGDTATLISETYVEGPDRHLRASYGAAATVDGDPAATLALVDPVVEANIALATAIADLSIAALPSARVRKDR